MYSDAPGPVNGNPIPLTDQTVYRINIDFAPNDTITGVFGFWADQCCYTRAIVGLGFNMASGRQYGPYGADYGNPFRFTGPVYGIYGTTSTYYYATYTISSMGFWTTPSSPPPAPPSPPPSLATPPATPAGAVYNMGRVRTIFNGNGDINGLFDDGASYTGRFSRGLISLLRPCHGPAGVTCLDRGPQMMRILVDPFLENVPVQPFLWVPALSRPN